MIDPGFFQENQRTAPAAAERKLFTTADFRCANGFVLPEVTVAYETWGDSAAPAVLVQHAISGDSHAIGWWERIVGPGRAIDTDRFFVIGHNALGGCQGTAGPSSLAPDGRPYGSRFPQVTVEDMVDLQERLLGHLGVSQLHLTAGGSMGGMMALEVARRNLARNVFLTATCARHSAMQIGFNETARQAILRDPCFLGGDYYEGPAPEQGIAVARMVGHLSYLSPAAFEAKFARRRQEGKDCYEVESYLNYQGDKFAHRFDANSLIVLSRAIDAYDCASLEGCRAAFFIVSFASDLLYLPSQSAELLDMAQRAGCRAEWQNIDLPWGHDSFLLDGEHQAQGLMRFLNS